MCPNLYMQEVAKLVLKPNSFRLQNKCLCIMKKLDVINLEKKWKTGKERYQNYFQISESSHEKMANHDS